MSTTEELVRSQQQEAAEAAAVDEAPPRPPADAEEETGQHETGPVFRPLAAAALTSAAAGAMTGGIFGVWSSARVFGAVAAVLGVTWAYLALRQKKAVFVQAMMLPVAAAVGVISFILRPGADPSLMPDMMREAITDGRLLRPPVPFDAGWTPILVILMFMLGFAAAWIGSALKKPQMGMMLPLLVAFLTAISQPAEGELVAALMFFIPLLAAAGVLYGGDAKSASELTSAFEIKRAIRAVPFAVLIIGLVVGVSRADFLFPDPIYDPAERPQRPRAVPLSEVEDRVLFEVEPSDEAFTGPWRTGTLDIYDGIDSWRLPPFNEARFEPLPDDGIVDGSRQPTIDVLFTARDLGATPTFPGTATPLRFQLHESPEPKQVVFDPRTDTFRVREGRIEANTVYTVSLPDYPAEGELQNAVAPRDPAPHTLEIPNPPPAVQDLLDQAPSAPWERLDFLRGELLSVAVATGSGEPGPVPVAKIQEILAGNNEGSPYEIVAAEAMLARWAGLPSRIGFGFDGFNEDDPDAPDAKTIRPRNGASWLEVEFEGYGWVPLIAMPEHAQETLETNPDARHDVEIQPSEDVAVEVFVPVELDDLRLLYERIRAELMYWLPFIIAGTIAYMAWPAVLRRFRQYRRRKWGEANGPRAQIAAEYAEFRDAATDLTVGDRYDTPLEYLDKVTDDEEHEELAWLVTRAMYGDLYHEVTAADAEAAEKMGASLRRRIFRAQPFQSRVLAVLSRASLKLPYTTEVPTVPQLRIPRPQLRGGRSRRRPGERRRVLSRKG